MNLKDNFWLSAISTIRQNQDGTSFNLFKNQIYNS